MKVSVILCTYNRSSSLLHALESIAVSQMPASFEWQVLIVDNNSHDQTREVAEAFCRRDTAHFRYVFESQQGKSYALNTGIAQSQGDVLAFTDDDVMVEPNWLQELTKPFEDPGWAGTGGRVYLPLDFFPPPWLGLDGPYSMGGILALFDPGPEPSAFSTPPIGANMAYRKEVFSKYGGFRTDLGPSPGRAIRYEDTEFGSRLLKAGERIQYVPSAIVRHAVPAERVHKKYFLTYFYGYGRAVIREKENMGPVWMIPRPLVSLANRVLHLLPRRISWWLAESDPRARFHKKCCVWMMAGEIVELLVSSHGKDSRFQPQAVK
jgi:glycosyltransferase involved in cell wall biosynthesis